MAWTKDQDDKLIRLKTSLTPVKEIAKMMERTEATINNRIAVLKARGSPDYLADIVRKCPKCNGNVIHKNKTEKIRSEKSGRQCRKCLGLIYKEKFKGEGNPFFGKKHSEEVKMMIVERNKNMVHTDEWKLNAGKILNGYWENKERISSYEWWVRKFGEEIANQKIEDLKKRCSIATSGERNPMYGKPTPKKAGNGWSGWYKDFYFRSLRELQFFIENEEFIEPTHLDRRLSVKYIGINGQKRTYSPDFILNKKTIIEIKPKKLWNTRENKLKFDAMKNFCEQNKLEFKVLDVKIDGEMLKEKYLKGEIKLDKKCDEKFRKYCGLE